MTNDECRMTKEKRKGRPRMTRMCANFSEEKLFLVIGSGEGYETRIVPESKLITAWEEMIFGEVGTAPCQEINIARERIGNNDFWICNQDLGRVHYHEDVGETDHLDFYLITPCTPSRPEHSACAQCGNRYTQTATERPLLRTAATLEYMPSGGWIAGQWLPQRTYFFCDHKCLLNFLQRFTGEGKLIPERFEQITRND